MGIPIYQVDAFASKAFSGNPAGVCCCISLRMKLGCNRSPRK